MPRVAKKAEEKETKTKKAVVKAGKKADKAVKVAKTSVVATKPIKEAKKAVSNIEKTKVAVEEPAKAPKKAKKEVSEDTGSVSFQIENFTAKIKSLTKHLQEHIHDFDSRRGLLIMVGKRRRLLNYLKKNDAVEYEKAVKKLKLKA